MWDVCHYNQNRLYLPQTSLAESEMKMVEKGIWLEISRK